MSSSDAPPPVERWVTRSARPNWCRAADESPPPTTRRALGVPPRPRRRRACRPRTARARRRPSGRSRTPCRRRRSPRRRPRRCAGRCRGPSSRRARRRRRARGARCRRRRPRRGRGRRAGAACRCRASSSSRAGSRSSSAHSESPIEWPCTDRNGKAMAPPMRIASARSRKASSTPILSVTLAPPTIATSGRAGSSRMPVSVSHLALQEQARGARQQVRDALGRGVRAVRRAEGVVDVDVGERGQARGELGIVLRLPRLEADVLEHDDVAVGDVVEVGGELARRCRAARPGARPPGASENASSRPLGRPRWEVSSRRAPCSRSHSIVGSAARMRVSSVISPSCSGTLKSTRTRTRLPSTSRSSSVLTGPSGGRRRSGWSSPTRCRTRRRP